MVLSSWISPIKKLWLPTLLSLSTYYGESNQLGRPGPVLVVLIERGSNNRSRIKHKVKKHQQNTINSGNSEMRVLTPILNGKSEKDIDKLNVDNLSYSNRTSSSSVPSLKGIIPHKVDEQDNVDVDAVLMVTPRAIERYLLDGELVKRTVPPDTITCCMPSFIPGIGRVLICGTQLGHLYIFDTISFTAKLIFDPACIEMDFLNNVTTLYSTNISLNRPFIQNPNGSWKCESTSIYTNPPIFLSSILMYYYKEQLRQELDSLTNSKTFHVDEEMVDREEERQNNLENDIVSRFPLFSQIREMFLCNNAFKCYSTCTGGGLSAEFLQANCNVFQRELSSLLNLLKSEKISAIQRKNSFSHQPSLPSIFVSVPSNLSKQQKEKWELPTYKTENKKVLKQNVETCVNKKEQGIRTFCNEDQTDTYQKQRKVPEAPKKTCLFCKVEEPQKDNLRQSKREEPNKANALQCEMEESQNINAPKCEGEEPTKDNALHGEMEGSQKKNLLKCEGEEPKKDNALHGEMEGSQKKNLLKFEGEEPKKDNALQCELEEAQKDNLRQCTTEEVQNDSFLNCKVEEFQRDDSVQCGSEEKLKDTALQCEMEKQKKGNELQCEREEPHKINAIKCEGDELQKHNALYCEGGKSQKDNTLNYKDAERQRDSALHCERKKPRNDNGMQCESQNCDSLLKKKEKLYTKKSMNEDGYKRKNENFNVVKDFEVYVNARYEICRVHITCSFGSFGTTLIAGDSRGRIFIWKVPSGCLQQVLYCPVFFKHDVLKYNNIHADLIEPWHTDWYQTKIHVSALLGIHLEKGEHHLLASFGNGIIAVYDLNTGDCIHVLNDLAEIRLFELLSRMSLILSLNESFMITAWDGCTFERLLTLSHSELTNGTPITCLKAFEAEASVHGLPQATLILGCVNGSIYVHRLFWDHLHSSNLKYSNELLIQATPFTKALSTPIHSTCETETLSSENFSTNPKINTKRRLCCTLLQSFIRDMEPCCPVSSMWVDTSLDVLLIGDASGIVATLSPIVKLKIETFA